MTNTTISVIRGRGCKPGTMCHDCGGTECTFNDVVVVASKVTLVARGGGESFKKLSDRKNISIEHCMSHFYMRSTVSNGRANRRFPYMSPNPEMMTIYYYATDSVEGQFKGMPVVLNFSDSNCYLRCSREGGVVSMRVETCDKQQLKMIAPHDQDTLCFLFYMKAASKSNLLRFESAAFPGWFLHTSSQRAQVKRMEKGEEEEPAFIFIIKKN